MRCILSNVSLWCLTSLLVICDYFFYLNTTFHFINLHNASQLLRLLCNVTWITVMWSMLKIEGLSIRHLHFSGIFFEDIILNQTRIQKTLSEGREWYKISERTMEGRLGYLCHFKLLMLNIYNIYGRTGVRPCSHGKRHATIYLFVPYKTGEALSLVL